MVLTPFLVFCRLRFEKSDVATYKILLNVFLVFLTNGKEIEAPIAAAAAAARQFFVNK